MGRLVWIAIAVPVGIIGFFILVVFLDSQWTAEREKLARELCDAIPVGTPATVAKERARAMTKVAADLEIKELQIRLMFLNPYSPGDKIVCEANLANDRGSCSTP
jgi:hypothetical protein